MSKHRVQALMWVALAALLVSVWVLPAPVVFAIPVVGCLAVAVIEWRKG